MKRLLLLSVFLAGCPEQVGQQCPARTVSIGQFALALRTATFLSGVTRSRDLSRRAPVVTGDTREWIAQLGYDRRPRSAK